MSADALTTTRTLRARCMNSLSIRAWTCASHRSNRDCRLDRRRGGEEIQIRRMKGAERAGGGDASQPTTASTVATVEDGGTAAAAVMTLTNRARYAPGGS